MAKKDTIQEMANAWMETKSQAKLKELIKRLTPGLYKHISHLESQHVLRMEILNDAFSIACEKINQYDPTKGSFSTWIYKIAFNCGQLRTRHTNRSSSLDSIVDAGLMDYVDSVNFSTLPEDEFDETSPEVIINNLQFYAIEAVKNFPENKNPKIKRALILRSIEDKKFKDIAVELEENENTVKGWVCRARAEINEMLTAEHPKLVRDYKKMFNDKIKKIEKYEIPEIESEAYIETAGTGSEIDEIFEDAQETF